MRNSQSQTHEQEAFHESNQMCYCLDFHGSKSSHHRILQLHYMWKQICKSDRISLHVTKPSGQCIQRPSQSPTWTDQTTKVEFPSKVIVAVGYRHINPGYPSASIGDHVKTRFLGCGPRWRHRQTLNSAPPMDIPIVHLYNIEQFLLRN